MDQVNRLLGISLGSTTNFQAMREILEKNLGRFQGQPGSNYLPELSVDYEERIKFMSKFYQWIPGKPELLQKLTKNNELSRALRTKANEFFEKRNLQEALKLYYAAITFAEPDGEDLGLAFANRSAVMLEQKDPKGGLKDIELAIKHNYPERLMGKLEIRRKKFLDMLEDIERSYAIEDIKSDMATRRKFRDELIKLKNPSPTIPSAENFVEIAYTVEAGRQLVVNKDVPIGTVVILERPFASVDLGILKFEAPHCDTCGKFVKNAIPCERCVFVIYCSEECRSNAECGHHKFECSCLSSFYLESTDLGTQVAFRIVCKVGPEELYRLFSTRDPSYFGLKKPYGTESGYKYESDSYLSVHHLFSHSNELEEHIRYDNGLKALQLVSILEARTNFFGLSPQEKRNDFKNFVAAILLRSIEMVDNNRFEEEEIRALRDFTLTDVYLRNEVQKIMQEAMTSSSLWGSRSSGIYCVVSLMNHSCDANVNRVFVASHGTMAIVTKKVLRKGEPLTISYGIGYQTFELSERKLSLKLGYHFSCQCIACKNDWPTESVPVENTRSPETFTCPSCSKKFRHEEKGCGEFLKCCLSNSRAKCGLCGKSYEREMLYQGFKRAMMKLYQGRKDNLNNRPFEALKASREVEEYLQFNIRPPHCSAGSNQSSAEMAVALILHFAE